MNQSTCIECSRPRRKGTGGRGMCITCYSAWFRANRKKDKTCAWCGKGFQTARSSVNHCSASCGSSYANSLVQSSEGWAKYQEVVQANKKPTKPSMSKAELLAHHKSQRGDIRSAYEDMRWADLIAAIYMRCEVSATGCWEWQGRAQQSKKSSSPYPVMSWKNPTRNMLVHRMSLEGKHGALLGTQQSHHVCANTMCVNPDHLQAATHLENVAEMKARKSYRDRIAELEEALRTVNPMHEALDRVSYL